MDWLRKNNQNTSLKKKKFRQKIWGWGWLQKTTYNMYIEIILPVSTFTLSSLPALLEATSLVIA